MKSLVLSIPPQWPARSSDGITPVRNGGKSMLQLCSDRRRNGVCRRLQFLNLEGKFSDLKFSSGNCLGKERNRLCRVAVFRAVSSKPWVEGEVSEAESVTLYKRISRLVGQESSAVEVLQEWLGEGRRVRKFQLQRIIKDLRKYRKYKHALELLIHLEWQRGCKNDSQMVQSCMIMAGSSLEKPWLCSKCPIESEMLMFSNEMFQFGRKYWKHFIFLSKKRPGQFRKKKNIFSVGPVSFLLTWL